MDIEILKNGDRASFSGEALLRRMDSPTLKTLDVFVREAVQNSLDATLEHSRNIRVDIDIGDFDTVALSRHFPAIRSELLRRYGGEKSDFIAVSDRGTTGLTGVYDMDNRKTRLQGLVYHIGENNKSRDSGGSWGYGKTVFFRVGAGLVIYYSRVWERGRYVNLLAATLVENQNNKPIVGDPGGRGIAYFGVSNGSGKTVPVTDESEIESVLDIFGMSLYEGADTGTVVIIPFIAGDKLLREACTGGFDNSPEWMLSLEGYVSCAVQRWYAPRLTSVYGEKWLKARVNGNLINENSMLRFFRLVQYLYLYGKEEDLSVGTTDIYRTEIKLKNVVHGGCVGWLTAVCREKAELRLGDGAWSVCSLIGRNDSENPSCVVTYARKPGMFIRYETDDTDGGWCSNIPVGDDKILIAVFVLNSEAYLRTGGQNLEGYIRSCELASHDNWADSSKQNIVTKIRSNVRNKLRERFGGDRIPVREKESNLTDIFTSVFLPPSVDRSDTGYPIGKKSAAVSGKKRKRSSLKLTDNKLVNGNRELTFEIILGSSGKSGVKFEMMSETGSIDPEEWEKDTGNSFPIRIWWVAVTGMLLEGTMYGLPKERIVDLNAGLDFPDVGFTVLKTSKDVPYAVRLIGEKDVGVRLKIRLACDVPTLTFEWKIMSERELV